MTTVDVAELIATGIVFGGFGVQPGDAVDLGEAGGFAAAGRTFHIEDVALDRVACVKIGFKIAAHF